ncbi:MAG TPA: helix-turn-helix domain-containing protein [Caulobacteraceae bacterium]|jgi:AcrR family transcriptional regulator|nr:helix-turn-helix domain-containing protein [Caulobacteraceae bacterium]
MQASFSKSGRDRSRTEAKLREAVLNVLVEGGFGALTPTAVGKAAGVDKMLIYRYFGGMDGLMQAVADGPGVFPTFEEVCGGDPAAARALPVPERAALVLDNMAQLLMARPAVLELMVWELVERNALTAITETARETMGLRIGAELFADVAEPELVGAVGALLSAGVIYLALRRRKIRWFNGIDLRSDAGWAQIRTAIATMTAGLG